MQETQQQPAPAGGSGPQALHRAQFEVGTVVERIHQALLGLGRRRRSTGAAQLLSSGAMLVQKNTDDSSFVVWVGAVARAVEEDEAVVRLVVRGPVPRPEPEGFAAPIVREVEARLRWYCIDSEQESSGLPPDLRFFHGHLVVGGLDAAAEYDVELVPGRLGFAKRIRAKTLPAQLEPGRPLRLFAASCYDADTDKVDAGLPGHDDRDVLDKAFKAVFRDQVPDLTLLLGDQVYADAPALRYALVSRHAPRTGLLMKYWRSWGMQPDPDQRKRQGLRGVLGSGPTYFLPDDHEFWNNWPNRTVTAKHSYGNIRAALRNSLRRRASVVPNTGVPVVVPPHDPRIAPWDAYQQNYLPVHPAEWDAWGLASFELFESFQTPALAPALSGGEREFPPALAGPPPPEEAGVIHRPRFEVVQRIDVAPVTIVLLDTRTRRTRRMRHPYHSGFVDPQFLEQALDAAAEAPVFVLALSQPVLQRAAWLDNRYRRERFSLLGDTGMQDYWHQYHRFWAELVHRRAGRPTITVGGDIHQSYVAVVESEQLNLVEVAASPMSLVSGGQLLEPLSRLKAVFTRERPVDYRPGRPPFVRMQEVVAGPAGGYPVVTGSATSRGCLPKNVPGFAGLAFERLGGGTVVYPLGAADPVALAAGAAAVRFDVRLFDRDATAVTAAAGCAPTAQVARSFLLGLADAPALQELEPGGRGLAPAGPA